MRRSSRPMTERRAISTGGSKRLRQVQVRDHRQGPNAVGPFGTAHPHVSCDSADRKAHARRARASSARAVPRSRRSRDGAAHCVAMHLADGVREVSGDSDAGYSSQDSCGSESVHPNPSIRDMRGQAACNHPESTRRTASQSAPAAFDDVSDWGQLPTEALVVVFRQLRLQDVGRCAQVCSAWNRATQDPRLWRMVEFVLSSSSRCEQTSPGLVNFILEKHAQHLKFVVLRTDSSVESAQSACAILSRLVKCSLKTLALMSGAARPVFLDVDQQQFASALTLVLDHSPLLKALAVDNTLVDDPSLQALANSNPSSLQRLLCKSCPRLSPGGVLALVDHCHCLRELSLSYTLLSDDLLLALSSELHARLEVLRVDVYSDSEKTLRPISPLSWQALVAHSPQLNLVMYLFAIQDDCFADLLTSYIPVTHLYFGDYVPNFVLGRVGQHCPQLVELVVGANGNSLIDQQLLGIGTNCQQLSSLGLAECQVTCSAFVRFAESCGPRLSELVVMEECLIEDSTFDLATTCARVSKILGRDWSPEFMPMW